jgi:DNA-binding NtrC family response regulator
MGIAGGRMTRILVVEENLAARADLAGQLRKGRYEVLEAGGEAELYRRLEEDGIDLILADLLVGGKTVGFDLLDRLGEKGEATPEVILLLRESNIQNAVEAIRKGASDVLVHPYNKELLALSVQRAVEKKRLKSQVRHLSSALKRRHHVEGVVYQSQQMAEILRLVERASQVEAAILIQGESGTGKEMIAGVAHALSPRRSGPFHVIDCGTIPGNLLESELFGHKRGAFTGAESDRKGLFESAQGGTLLLDEVGELPFSLQVKLLRVLQEKEIRSLGSDRSRKVDVRILAATNKDLREEIEKGRFREDLYYRLNVVSIRVPPLRERTDDVLPLAKHFLRKHARKRSLPPLNLDPAAASLMLRYPWPGNVRELENAMERAVALTTGEVLRPEDLPETIRGTILAPAVPLDAGMPLEELEKRYILHVLKQQGGNRIRAAAVLKIGRNTLWRKLRSYGYEQKKNGNVHR